MTLSLARKHAPGKVILVTRDTNMRIKADALGVPAEDYANAHLSVEEHYSGVQEITVSADVIAEIYTNGWVPRGEYSLHANQFVVFSNADNPKQQARVRYHPEQERLLLIRPNKDGVWGVQARNMEQLFALDLLLDPNLNFVTLTGMAGTGKTLLPIAAGLK